MDISFIINELNASLSILFVLLFSGYFRGWSESQRTPHLQGKDVTQGENQHAA